MVLLVLSKPGARVIFSFHFSNQSKDAGDYGLYGKCPAPIQKTQKGGPIPLCWLGRRTQRLDSGVMLSHSVVTAP